MLGVWYKDAILYELDVKTFQDSNGDGIGDFLGLMRRLPYIAGLGATCLWLRPFFPSPWRDDGYDISDYYAVDPRLGSFGEFAECISRASDLGLRVIVDLVVNHTSVDHPWFQSARRDPASPYRDFYIWSQEKPTDLERHLVFPGEQKTNWTYDDQAQAWYYHHFFWHQPDLNTENPAVRQEIARIISFWVQLGLSGFRVDAVPFLLEHVDRSGGTRLVSIRNQEGAQAEKSFHLLREMRQALNWKRGDAIFLAEANVPVKFVPQFFGPGGDRMHMLFDFDLNAKTFLALALGKAAPLLQEIQRVVQIPLGSQWLNFLRNHDGLDLGRLTEEERRKVFDRFAPEETMRVYGRAIRRRLAPLMGGDEQRIVLAHAVMLSLPGTPMIRYGEEIGMGEDLSLPGRLAVRTPMQWSNDPQGGFSAASPDQLIRPVMEEGPYGYQQINVAEQQNRRDSPLNRIGNLIRIRRQCPEFGQGAAKPLQVGHSAVVAVRLEFGQGAVITLHNLSDQAAEVEVPLDANAGEQLRDLLGHSPAAANVPPHLTLAGQEFRWFRVVGGGWQTR